MSEVSEGGRDGHSGDHSPDSDVLNESGDTKFGEDEDDEEESDEDRERRGRGLEEEAWESEAEEEVTE